MTRDGALIVAPYPGEFGWELMNWQGRVRRLIHNSPGRRFVIVAPPDRRTLFGDLLESMPDRVTFRPCRPLDFPGHACDDHRVDDAGRRMDAARLRSELEAFTQNALGHDPSGRASVAGEIFTAPLNSTMWPAAAPHQAFASLRRPGPIQVDVAMVPRYRTIAADRNRPAAWWRDLAHRLRSCGLVVAECAAPLSAAVATLSQARLAIGASTGGLHLASLCECPHFVWGPGAESLWTPWRISNRQRYETIWNPLGTACLYDDCGWQPTIEHVVRGTLAALSRIGLRRRPEPRPRRASGRWQIRRKLSALITADPAGSVVPWRVREFVRERLI